VDGDGEVAWELELSGDWGDLMAVEPSLNLVFD
jgi:hypothetical protein